MWAYKVPYPRKEMAFSDVSFPELSSALKHYKPWTVDFPGRYVSYAIVGCKQADLPRCVEEVCKAVDFQARGQEPPMLEIRLAEPQ
jgi:hypothetical protein